MAKKSKTGRPKSKNSNSGKSKSEFAVYMNDAPEDKCFWCSDGTVLHNLSELVSYLNSASEESFHSHVDGQKNDFASWIYDVIGDVKLAEALRDTTDRKETVKKIKSRIAYIKRSVKA